MKPPLTNRGVTIPSNEFPAPMRASIDWLQYSVEWPPSVPSWPSDTYNAMEILKRALPPTEEIVLTGEIIHPLRGYSDGMAATHARLFWHKLNRMQHIGVLMTGEDLRGILTIPYPHHALVRWVVAKAKKIARLDLAIDVFDPKARPLDILRLWKRGDVGTPARTVSSVSSYKDTREKGVIQADTVYVGSRDGDRFVRIYDKAAEQGVEGSWTRVEMVAKDERAWNLAKSCALYGIERSAQTAIGQYINVPNLAWWRNMLTGELAYIDPVGRKETGRDKWLYSVALPVLERRAKELAAEGQWRMYDELEAALARIVKGDEE